MRKSSLLICSLFALVSPSLVSAQTMTVLGRDQIVLQIHGLETDATFQYDPGSSDARPRLQLDDVINALSYADAITVESSSSLIPQIRAGRDNAMAPTFDSISIAKTPDVTSPALRLSAANQRPYDRATIHIVQPTGYFRIELEEVTLGGIDTAMSESGKLVETIKLNFKKIVWDYQGAGERETGAAAISPGAGDASRSRAEWDVEQGRGG